MSARRTLRLIHVFVEGGNVGFGYFRAGFALAVGTGNDFVVHVGKVAHEGHVVAEMTQIAVQHVEHHRGAGVADMTEIVGRNAAGVHAHLAGPARLEVFLAACHGIIQLHGSLPCCCLSCVPEEIPDISPLARKGRGMPSLNKSSSGPVQCKDRAG